MPVGVNPNQEFLEFLLGNGDIRKSNNFGVIFSLELQYPGIFAKIMSDFNKAKSFRETLDEKEFDELMNMGRAQDNGGY